MNLDITKSIVYHYTSLETMKCMFDHYSKENPYITFWASNCAFMNDTQEVSEGIELVRDVLNKELPINLKKFAEFILQNSTNDIKDYFLMGSAHGKSDIPYAISFSRNEDNLNLWRMYGDSGRGIALGFDIECIKPTEASIIECVYNQDDDILMEFKATMIKEFLSLYNALDPPPGSMPLDVYAEIMTCAALSRYISKIKNSCYAYEDECRLTMNCSNTKFRVINGVLVPYTEIEIPIDSLHEIVIGPDCNRLNINSLNLFFASKGLNRIEKNIRQSTIPYRN